MDFVAEAAILDIAKDQHADPVSSDGHIPGQVAHIQVVSRTEVADVCSSFEDHAEVAVDIDGPSYPHVHFGPQSTIAVGGIALLLLQPLRYEAHGCDK